MLTVETCQWGGPASARGPGRSWPAARDLRPPRARAAVRQPISSHSDTAARSGLKPPGCAVMFRPPRKGARPAPSHAALGAFPLNFPVTLAVSVQSGEVR
jgi:hypothetical protein